VFTFVFYSFFRSSDFAFMVKHEIDACLISISCFYTLINMYSCLMGVGCSQHA